MFELTKEVTKIVVKNEKFKDVTIFVPENVEYHNCSFQNCRVLHKKINPEDGLYSFAYSCYFEKTDITSY